MPLQTRGAGLRGAGSGDPTRAAWSMQREKVSPEFHRAPEAVMRLFHGSKSVLCLFKSLIFLLKKGENIAQLVKIY